MTKDIVAVFLASMAIAGCQPKAQPHANFPPPEVSVIAAEPKDLPVAFEYVGQTAGSREVEVRARVAGILQKRHYEEGRMVRAGQLMFTIDPEPMRAVANRAAADLAAAEARLAMARRDAARMKPLFEGKAVSRKEYDDAISGEQIAAADVKAAQARLAETRLNLGYTRVDAPITGIASRAMRSEGNYISSSDVLLTTVIQVDPIYVNFGISGTDQLRIRDDIEAGRLKLPQDGKFEVTVRLANGEIYGKSGRLDFTDPRLSSVTGTSDARAALPNPDGVLQPGQFVRVRLSGAMRPNAILAPQRAVLEGPQGKYVYVVNADSKIEARPVEVGEWSGDQWIINKGLKPGERMVVDGVMKIGPGAPVKAIAAKPETAPVPPAPAEKG